MLKLLDRDTGTVVAHQVRSAHTHWTRFKGLLGTSSLPEGHGLWIKPCKQIHMFFMRYAIDVLFLDEDLRVVGCAESQPIGSISTRYGDAISVVELPAGTIARLGVRPGSRLEFQTSS